MKCRQAQDLIGAYIYGDLAPDEMRDLRVHAQECTLCREDLASRGRIISSLDDSVPVLTDEDRQRIAWSVRGAVRKQQSERKPLARRLIPALALSAVLAAGIFVGRYVVMQSQPTAHKVVKDASSPSVKVQELPPADNNPNANQIADQISELLLALSNPATATLAPNRASASSRNVDHPAFIPPENPFNLAPQHHVQATPSQPQSPEPDSAEPPEDSVPTVDNTETGMEPEATQLPKVTDPKNAETTPSENQ